MKKLFKVCRDGKWEEMELDVEPGTEPKQVGPFIEYTPPKELIPSITMGLIAFLVLVSAVIITGLILCFI